MCKPTVIELIEEPLHICVDLAFLTHLNRRRDTVAAAIAATVGWTALCRWEQLRILLGLVLERTELESPSLVRGKDLVDREVLVFGWVPLDIFRQIDRRALCCGTAFVDPANAFGRQLFRRLDTNIHAGQRLAVHANQL